MDTKEVIASMLKENTGRHFLDSGDYYGRHWERNQERDFDKEPPVLLKFRPEYNEIEFTINLYHFLCEKLEYDEDMQARYDAWVEENSDDNTGYLQDMTGFIHDENHDFAGIYGDGNPIVEYTYNVDNALSQDIQFAFFTDDSREQYVLLQIHNGCDARGGLTAPKAFRCTEELSIFDYCRGGIAPEYTETRQMELMHLEDKPALTEINWSTDDGGYSWYYDGGTGPNQLDKFEMSEDEEDRGNGKIYVDEDGNGYCPFSGQKLLGGLF